jgi:hypothetical protein
MSETKKVFWHSKVPSRCQISSMEITDSFVDGRTASGHWAIMHPDAYAILGHPFGTGFSQLYKKQGDGSWLKISG